MNPLLKLNIMMIMIAINPITSKDIQFVLDTLSKQAPYDKTQIKQIFYGICSLSNLYKNTS